MSHAVEIRMEMPDDWPELRLPEGVQRRLQSLLDRQDLGETLTSDERSEAEGLLNMAELLCLLRARTEQYA